MNRTTQGLAGVVVSAAFVGLHYAGVMTLPPEVLGTMLIGLTASLGWTAHGVQRRIPRRCYGATEKKGQGND